MRGKPIVDYNVEMCRKAGIRKVYVLAGPMAEVIQDYYLNDKSVTVVKEREPLGTAGAIAQFLDGSDDYLVMNGDSVYYVDINKFIEALDRTYCDIVMGVCQTRDASRFGMVKIRNGYIDSFEEKRRDAEQGYVSVGLYAFKKKFVMKADGFQMLETSVFPKEAASKNIKAFEMRWWPVDDPERHAVATKNMAVWNE